MSEINYIRTKSIPEESLWTTYWKNLVASLPSIVFAGLSFFITLFALLAIVFSAFDEGSKPTSTESEWWALLLILAIPVIIFVSALIYVLMLKVFYKELSLGKRMLCLVIYLATGFGVSIVFGMLESIGGGNTVEGIISTISFFAAIGIPPLATTKYLQSSTEMIPVSGQPISQPPEPPTSTAPPEPPASDTIVVSSTEPPTSNPPEPPTN